MQADKQEAQSLWPRTTYAVNFCFTDFSFADDVISWREDLRPKLENEVFQNVLLKVTENFHLPVKKKKKRKVSNNTTGVLL